MFKKILGLFLILMLCGGTPVFAAIAGHVGGTDDDGVAYSQIDTDGLVTYVKTDIEIQTTSDTITVEESGKTFLININSGTLTDTLPTSGKGLTYSFVSINGSATSGQGTCILNPQSTDIFYGCVDSDSASTFTAGDDLDSPGATGDSVTIIGGTNAWYCTHRVGTWVDGN